MAQVYQKTGTVTKTAYRDAERVVEQDTGFETIAVCRPKFIFFKFLGLRPNTPHWIFFDDKKVTEYVNTSYSLDDYNSAPRGSQLREPGDSFIKATGFPVSLGGSTGEFVNTDNSGTLEGAFYLQSNSTLSFPTGSHILTAIDISVLNLQDCLSFGQLTFVSTGVYDTFNQVKEIYQQQYSYQEDVFGYVNVPNPPAQNNGGGGGGGGGGGNDNDHGRAGLVYSHYEPRTKTTTKFAGGITHAEMMKQRKATGGTFDAAAANGADGDGGTSQDKKIVCTAMNESYGFGSYRQAIWISYARKHLTKEHEVGYHTLFLPLVYLAYKKNYTLVRRILEHGTRHRTADLRAEMQNKKRDKLGRFYRFFLEPLCYVVGKVKMKIEGKK
jgi:hypothetical protein